MRQHISAYVASNGEEGHLWNGVPTLLLTTTGRRSGAKRRTPLIHGRDANDYVLVASYAGAPAHPAWFLNIEANPRVEIQAGSQALEAIAHVAPPSDRERLWPLMASVWPSYEEYQAKTKRIIPIRLLSRLP